MLEAGALSSHGWAKLLRRRVRDGEAEIARSATTADCLKERVCSADRQGVVRSAVWDAEAGEAEKRATAAEVAADGWRKVRVTFIKK